MVYDIVLTSIRTGSVARMSGPVHPSLGILMENAAIGVFLPALILHRVIPDQFEHADTVEWGVDSCS